MSRIVVVAGVHLDRAWPQLGSAFGEALRRWSRDVLARVVDQARQKDAQAILVVGDLLDRSTVLPDTLEFAAAVFGSFPGSVLIAPGSTDWAGGDGPYRLGRWPDNVHTWTSAVFEPAQTLPDVWGSAWTSPSFRAPRPPAAATGEGFRTLASAGLSAADLTGLLAPGDLLLTSGKTDRDGVLGVTDLVHEPGEVGGWALLMDTQHRDGGVEVIDLSGQPGSSIEVDVTALDTPEDFRVEVERACTTDGPVCLRLVGELRTGILLPGFAGPELANHVVMDVSSLRYAIEVPDSSDRSARAEFLRAMAISRGDARERHQTTALGLGALDASALGA